MTGNLPKHEFTDLDHRSVTLQFRRGDTVMAAEFVGGCQFPVLLRKISQSAAAAHHCRAEADALERLAPVAAKLGIPVLISRAETSGGFCFEQSVARGLPWNMRPWRNGEIEGALERADEWLARFQSLVPVEGTAAGAAADILSLCRREVSGLTNSESALLAWTESLLPSFAAIPAVAAHGDFWSGNILEYQGSLYVIDWSTFHPDSPVADLYNFLAGIALERPERAHDARVADLWDMFFGASPLSGAAARTTLRALSRYQLGPDVAATLFAPFLAYQLARIECTTHAVWRAFIRRYMAAGRPAPLCGKTEAARAASASR